MVKRGGSVTALLVGLLVLSPLIAVEAKLQLPDPFVVGVVLRGGITIENASVRIDHLDLPTVEGLEWQSSQRSSYEVRLINGTRTTRETMSLALRAQQATELSIPAVTVVFTDGSSTTTAPIVVHPQAADAALAGEANATASFEPATIVPGEPAVLIYRLALRQDRVRAIKQPALTPPSGLLVTGERSEAKSETVDAEGREWSVQTWRWPVTAASPGTYDARGQQEWYRCRHDFFNQLVVESTHQAPIRPATLTVTPLPDAGRPDDFSGLIGPLDASASIDRARITMGEGVVYTVTLTGPQVSLGHRPTLALPASVQAYPKEDDAGEKTGERHFRWDLVPGNTGEITLPALAFPYFDPQTRTYRRTSTAALTIGVLPGRSRELVVSGATAPLRPLTATPVEEKVALPPPLRGAVATPAPMVVTWVVLTAALVGGALAGLAQRLGTRPRRGPHRGRALAAAIVAKDLDAMARAVHAMRPDLDDDGRRAADALEQAIDLARFGAGHHADLATLAAPLVGIA